MVLSKSWRDGAASTPQHHVDLALVDYWSPKIREALAASLTDAEIRTAVHAAHAAKVAGADPAEAARSVLAPLLSTTDLAKVLDGAIRDAYAIGGAAAGRQLSNPAEVKKAAGDRGGAVILPTPSITVDWANWQAGDLQAATMTADGGLAGLLDEAGISIKGITGSAVDTLGNQIGDGLVHGATVDKVADSLVSGGWVTADRAERIAHTETARAVSAATLDTYRINGIGSWHLVLSDGACDLCVEVANDGPYPNEDMDSAPPIHPYCRCSASPNTDDMPQFGDELLQGAGIGDEDTSSSLNSGDEQFDSEGRTLRDLDLGLTIAASVAATDIEGYLVNQLLGNPESDLHGQDLSDELNQGKYDEDIAVDLSYLTDTQLGEMEGVTQTVGTEDFDVPTAAMEELDSREQDAATFQGQQDALTYLAMGGTKPTNPYATDPELAALWDEAFAAALKDPKAAQADVDSYESDYE